MDCIFCKIANGEIPATKVYEDDTVVAFNDLEPQAPTHILVIPKQHITSAADITEDNSSVIAHIFEVIAKLSKDLDMADGFRVVNNCGDSAGQTVKHIHQSGSLKLLFKHRRTGRCFAQSVDFLKKYIQFLLQSWRDSYILSEKICSCTDTNTNFFIHNKPPPFFDTQFFTFTISP
jgi:histidine triad (HIT) family protein